MSNSHGRVIGLMMSLAIFGAVASNGQEGPLELRKNAVKTVTPPKYNRPDIVLRDGVYHQLFAPWDIQGCRSSIQVANGYSDQVAFNCDSVMIYSLHEKTVKTWTDKDDIYNIDMMLAINRAGLKWADEHPECIQTKRDGKRMLHGAKGSYYMVPTKDFIEYTWDVVKRAIVMFRPVTIAFEEPEMWNQSGYSDGFKAEWKEYFKEDWQDPQSSPEAMLKSMELKTWLFERIIGVMYERIEKLAPGTKMYIATHSSVNYNAWGITAGLNHYMATGKVDGIIGQTWSDTIRTPYLYKGGSVRDEFLTAYVDFTSYVDSTEGTNFFALADPMSDGPSTEQKNRYAYLQTIVASLMRPEIHRFELCPWVYRAFGNVTPQYRTIQQQCFNALNWVGGKAIELEAGTPGVAYAMSDTMSWLKKNAWSPATSTGLFGIMMPLATHGIPAGIKSMEQLYTAEDLSDVKVLIVSYDNMLPMSGKVNDAIAEWTKKGGILMLLSGKNDYWRMPDRFWAEKGSPVADLLAKLGVKETVDTTAFAEGTVVSGRGGWKASFNELHPPRNDCRFMVSYKGVAADAALFESGGRAVGFETPVGKGRLLAVGLPSTFYSTEDGCNLMRALTRHAVEQAGLQYVETNLMTTRRGGVVATHALRKDERLPGTYVDLFDSRLPVVKNPLVKAQNSRILFDVSTLDLKVPRVAFSGGEIVAGSLAEDNVWTQFTYTAASDSMISTRIIVPNGFYPAEVTALCDGEPVSVEMTWNGGSSSVLLQMAGNAKPTNVEVTWGDKPVESVPDPEPEIAERDAAENTAAAKTATGKFDDSRFLVSSKNGMKQVSRTVETNKSNLDADFLLKNSASANGGLRFCDMMGQLVYVFDSEGTMDYVVDLSVMQNYYVEVSGNAKDWKTIADYSRNGTVEHLKDGSNRTVLTVKAADHGLQGGKMYIRISNTDTTQGWGGSINWLRVSYTRK